MNTDSFRELKDYLSTLLTKKRTLYTGVAPELIDFTLFPYGIMEDFESSAHRVSFNKESIRDIINESWTKKKHHLVIKGEGGIGKTVTCLSIPEVIAPRNVPAIYIPLNELRVIKKEETIDDYIEHRVFSNRKNLYSQFISLIMMPWENGIGPQALLLLDGFNEIARDKQEAIGEDINRLAEDWPGIQIIVSSRNEVSPFICFREGYITISLQPLDHGTIANYLSRVGVPPPQTTRQWSIISLPLMLALYVRTEQAIQKMGLGRIKTFRCGDSAGDIIWNFLQRETLRFLSKPQELINCILSNEFIAPFIAWNMLKESSFASDEVGFNKLLRDAVKAIPNLSLEQFAPHIRSVLCDSGFYQFIPDITHVSNYLLKESGLFLRDKNSFSLMHQQLRDSLASLHLINSIYFSNGFPNEWKTIIDDDVVQFVSELSSRTETDILWEKNKDLSGSHIIETINMLDLQKHVRDYDFSDLDFSGLDFRRISLFPYRKPGTNRILLPKKAELMKGLRLSSYTLSSTKKADPVHSIFFTDNGSRCISCSYYGDFQLWDCNTYQCLSEYSNRSFIDTVSSSFNGERIVYSYANRLYFVDKKGDEIRPLGPFMLPEFCFISFLALSDDGRRCLVGSFNSISFVEFVDEEIKQRSLINVSGSTISCIAITSDGRRGLIGTKYGDIIIYDLINFTPPQTIHTGLESIDQILYIPKIDECLLVSEGKIMVWRMNGNNHSIIIDTGTHSIDCISFIPYSNNCIIGKRSEGLMVYDLSEGIIVRQPSIRLRSILNSIAVSPDGRFCVTGYFDGTLCFWDINELSTIARIEGYSNPVTSLVCLSEKKEFISSSKDGSMHLWDIDNCQCIKSFYFERKVEIVGAISINKQQNRCLFCQCTGSIIIMDLETFMVNNKYISGLSGVSSFAVSPNWVECIIGTTEGLVYHWALDSDAPPRVIGKRPGPVHTLELTMDKHYLCESYSRLVKGDYSGHFELSDKRHHGLITNIIITYNGERCASASEDGSVMYWKIDNLHCLNEKDCSKKYHDPVISLALTKEEECVCGLKSGSIQVWNPRTDVSIEVFNKDDSSINALTVMPKHRIIIAGTDDNTLQLIDANEKTFKTITILPLSLLHIDFSLAIIPEEFKDTLRQNGAIV